MIYNAWCCGFLGWQDSLGPSSRGPVCCKPEALNVSLLEVGLVFCANFTICYRSVLSKCFPLIWHVPDYQFIRFLCSPSVAVQTLIRGWDRKDGRLSLPCQLSMMCTWTMPDKNAVFVSAAVDEPQTRCSPSRCWSSPVMSLGHHSRDPKLQCRPLLHQIFDGRQWQQWWALA